MRTRIYDFREPPPLPAPDKAVPSRHLSPSALLLAIAASGLLLSLLGGPPHMPVRPDLRAIAEGLRSTDPPLQGAASWCFALGWVLWCWTVISLLAHVALLALERLTGGAAWVLTLRPALSPLLMPLVRRAFPVLSVGVIIARLAATPTPSIAAAPAPFVLALPGNDGSLAWPNGTRVASDTGPIEHTVVEGDTLWALAERYYGDGSLFPELHEANLGRPMPNGTRYEGRLHPGQVLLVPPIAPAAVPAAEQFAYTVERDDTLRAIAARFLGDEMRWPEIFALNQGIAHLPDGRTLINPDLIWPGLELTIPASPPAPAPGVGSPAPPSPPPVPAPPSPSPSPSPSSSPAPVVSTPTPSAPAVEPTVTAVPMPSPSATPVPPSPTPVLPAAAVVPATPPAAASPRPTPPGPPARSWPGQAPLVAGAGALVAAVVGGAVFLQRRQLLARRELRRRMRTAVSPAVVIREVQTDEPRDFADGDLLGTFTHRAHGGEVEPAVVLTHHAARFFAAEGLDGATPLLAIQGAHGGAALLVDAPRAARERLVALAPALGSLLGGTGRAVPMRASGDVELRLLGLTAAGLLAPPAGPGDAPLPTVMPLAELPGATPLFANWDALGNLLVAGGPGEGIDIAMTSLVATLASRRHPDTLRLWAIARPQELPPELDLLPHWGDPRIDPDDGCRVAALLGDLRAELDRRREEPPGTPRPELVLVLAEAADVLRRDDGFEDTTLELLATDGPAYGIRLLAATACPEALDDGTLRLFATRLVLRLADEAQSVRLLGAPDATALPGGGRLLLRLAGRPPGAFAGVPAGRARGYRIAPEALAALADQLGRTFGAGSETASATQRHEGDVHSNSIGSPSTPPADDEPSAGMASPGHIKADTESSGEGRATDARLPESAALTAVTSSSHAGGQSNPAPMADTGDVIPPTSTPESPKGEERLDAATALAESTGGDAPEPEGITPPAAVVAASRQARLRLTTPDILRPSTNASALAPEEITADLLMLDPGEEQPVAAPLDIRCFGPFRAMHAGELLAPRQHAKAWELLQLLAVCPPRSLTRDRLRTALWPDLDSVPSRNIFNTIVGRLRQELTEQVPGLPHEVVQKTRGDCWLDPKLAAVDVHRWLAILKREPRLPLLEALGEYRLARALYRPTLLEGASFEWLATREDGVTPEEEYQERWTDYRLRLARRCVREGRPDLAVPLFRGLIEEQPREEALVRELLRCYGQTGDLPGLERQMRTLEAVLTEGYGDEADPSRTPVAEQPEKETTAVYREISAALARASNSDSESAGG